MEYPVQVFEHEQFGKIRIVMINGEPWFVGKDVATALGYKNAREAVRYHVDASDKRGENILLPSGVQKTVVINKSGVYSLILDSNMPKAKEFRHWVTSEVLVQIEETGSYSLIAPAATPAPNPARRESQLKPARVYLLEMSDNTVKVGYSSNVITRTSKIEREVKMKATQIYFTPLMSREDARLVEWAFKKNYSSQRIKGEFFSVAFAEACMAVNFLVNRITTCIKN